jgi:hypothetical protein
MMTIEKPDITVMALDMENMDVHAASATRLLLEEGTFGALYASTHPGYLSHRDPEYYFEWASRILGCRSVYGAVDARKGLVAALSVSHQLNGKEWNFTQVHEWATHPQHRRNSHMHKLLGHASEQALEAGDLTVEANPRKLDPARASYLRGLGFEDYVKQGHYSGTEIVLSAPTDGLL